MSSNFSYPRRQVSMPISPQIQEPLSSNVGEPITSDLLNNFMQISPHTLVMKHVLSYSSEFLQKITGNKNTVGSNIKKIILLLLLSSLSMNFDKLFNLGVDKLTISILWIGMNIFMTTEIIDLTKNKKIIIDGFEVYPKTYIDILSEKLNFNLKFQSDEKKEWKSCGNGRIHITLSESDGYSSYKKITIKYNQILSGKYFNELRKIASEKSLIQGKIVKLITGIDGSGRCDVEEKCQQTMFAYKRYCHLYDEIRSYFEINNLINIRKPIGIILNGIPGTGKSSFCDYVCQKGICTNVIKINMMNYVNLDFKTILSAIKGKFQLMDNDLLCFDELDKYFNIYLMNKYQKQQSIANYVKEKDTKSAVSENTETSNNIMNEDNVKVNADNEYNESCIKETNTFLTNLNTFIDGEEISANIIIVFCANNFDTIFKYATEHFDSLKDRFIYETIEPYNVDDVCGFLSYYNSYFDGTDYQTTSEKIRELVPPNINITARKLHQLMVKNHYNIENTIKKINT